MVDDDLRMCLYLQVVKVLLDNYQSAFDFIRGDGSKNVAVGWYFDLDPVYGDGEGDSRPTGWTS